MDETVWDRSMRLKRDQHKANLTKRNQNTISSRTNKTDQQTTDQTTFKGVQRWSPKGKSDGWGGESLDVPTTNDPAGKGCNNTRLSRLCAPTDARGEGYVQTGQNNKTQQQYARGGRVGVNRQPLLAAALGGPSVDWPCHVMLACNGFR